MKNICQSGIRVFLKKEQEKESQKEREINSGGIEVVKKKGKRKIDKASKKA